MNLLQRQPSERWLQNRAKPMMVMCSHLSALMNPVAGCTLRLLAAVCSRYLTLVESLPTYGVHYYEVKVINTLRGNKCSDTNTQTLLIYCTSGETMNIHFKFSHNVFWLCTLTEYTKKKEIIFTYLVRAWYSNFTVIKILAPLPWVVCCNANCYLYLLKPATNILFIYS